MDALAGYGSDSDSESPRGAPSSALAAAPLSSSALSRVDVTPDVMLASRGDVVQFVDPTAKTLTVNATYDAMYAPVSGPVNPFRPTHLAQKNVLTGFVEEDNIDAHTFDTQRRTFLSYGYALDPSANAAGQRRYVGDTARAEATSGATVEDKARVHAERTRKRKDRGDAFNDPLNYEGPWAGYEGERMSIAINEDAAAADGEPESSAPVVEVEGAAADVDAEDGDDAGKLHMPSNERTQFHGKSEKDYLGRPWTTVPQDLDVNLLGTAGNQSCFLPKTLLHTWTGHTKGINAVRFIPNTGHLILSASMDNRIKVREYDW